MPSATTRALDPDLILSPRRDDAHQDHRTGSELVSQVFRRERTVLEYEIPKWDGDLGSANLYVPLSPAEATAKVEHMLSVSVTSGAETGSPRKRSGRSSGCGASNVGARDGFAEAFICRKLIV